MNPACCWNECYVTQSSTLAARRRSDVRTFVDLPPRHWSRLVSHIIFTECDKPRDQREIDRIFVPVDPGLLYYGPHPVFLPSVEWRSYLYPLGVSHQAVALCGRL